jgi:hypothetical protein
MTPLLLLGLCARGMRPAEDHETVPEPLPADDAESYFVERPLRTALKQQMPPELVGRRGSQLVRTSPGRAHFFPYRGVF